MIGKINSEIFILGMGVSGISLAKYLMKKKITVKCWDDNPEKRKVIHSLKIKIHHIALETLKNCDYLVVSPGINHEDHSPHEAVIIAKSLNIKIVTDLEFLKILNIKNPLIGVTGTNGKSTTTHFISQILSYKNFREPKCCGNIGTPFTDLTIKKKTLLVVEASSYQLAKINKLNFDYAFLLNISKDHIEWHGTFNKYIDSKLNIFKNQTKNSFAVICIDDINCRNIAFKFKKNFKSKLILISCKYTKNVDIYLKTENNKVKIFNKISKEDIEININKLNFVKAHHNFQNLLAAYTSSFLLNQKTNDFLDSLKNIRTLQHRIEFSGEFRNIHFYNDSKSTNVNSAKTAIKSFKNIFWILGGREKKGGLKGIENDLGNILKAYVYGECSENFKTFLLRNSVICCEFKTLRDSFNQAFKDAIKQKTNINILLSPACSSLDQFNNFEDRGKEFKQLVSEKIKISD